MYFKILQKILLILAFETTISMWNNVQCISKENSGTFDLNKNNKYVKHLNQIFEFLKIV